ncbi:flagellar hook protein FlgE [Paraburkholderia sp. GAS41]|jgi:flagellar hook protein FlgE|uniref:flagellar hook protein FlgE n=1 Tax=Paraburkholderia sp. GAS41 TaxID=3035134 RepID=UPI003D1D12AF
MGYQQGLSGLAAASSDLDVIGNNIANADTVGFKSGTAVFADLYANSVATAVNDQIGIGTQLAEVQQQFSQGTITTTGQSLDVAINGSGFYQMSNNGTLTYSRNGIFQVNKAGQITNAQGLQLMGYAANAAGVINTAQTVPLTVPTQNIAPAETTLVGAQFNLNAQSAATVGTVATPSTTDTGSLVSSGVTVSNPGQASNSDAYTITFTTSGTTPPVYSYSVQDNTATPTPAPVTGTYTAGTAIPLGTGQSVTFTGTPGNNDTVSVANTNFNQNVSTTYNYGNSFTAYDSLGGSQTVDYYFSKTSSGNWNIYAGVEGSPAVQVGTATFNSSGTLTSVTSTTMPSTTTDGVVFQIPNTDGSGTPQTITLNLTGTTQYGGTTGLNSAPSNNGYPAGTLSSYSINANGIITGTYSNQQTAALGQIVLANFNDPNGLVDLGNNEYEATAASGQPQIGVPGGTNLGFLQGGAVESSNVDLTNELVNLITAQRNYQANAQTIKTQQTVDQTLINM